MPSDSSISSTDAWLKAAPDHPAASLLDRLRRWPDLEPDPATRQNERDAWTRTVTDRRAAGRPRRILFVHGQLPGETGSGVYLQQISAEALRRGLDLYVLSAGYHTLTSADIPGVPDNRIFTCRFTPPGQTPQPGAVQSPISGMSVVMPYPVKAYRDRSEEELVDLLTVFGGRLAERIACLQPDILHVDHLWFLNGLARLIAPWIPLVASCHGTAYKLIADAPRFREVVVPCVASADHVCAISPQTLAECVETFQIPEKRITIEGYGFEPDLFYFQPVDRDGVLRRHFNYQPPPGSRLAVAVGKFVDWKGFKELTLAVGHLRRQGHDLACLIVGEGDPQSRIDLQAFIDGQGLTDHVRLPGKVARTDLPDIYRSADLYVLPSHVEPYGLVLMESLACGTPSIFARTGGPPDFVPPTLTDEGLAVMVDPIRLDPDGQADPKDREAYARRLAEGMATTLSKPITDTDRLRIAAAMQHLSWGRLVENLIGIYDRLSVF
ncbi:glycosyltransferase [Desulfatitalea tepidiphila]|uniref:glycosyltransferase n=1 Tax=Desulfatitalea tepidiphila TaxID=1185843 RepID=UPI0006B56954|nr:glycosyltransferase [Desulfatitalea tepidiphila]